MKRNTARDTEDGIQTASRPSIRNLIAVPLVAACLAASPLAAAVPPLAPTIASADELDDTIREAESLAGEIDKIGGELDASKARISELNGKIAAGQERQGKLRGYLARHVKATYKAGGPVNLLALALDPEVAVDEQLSRRLRRVPRLRIVEDCLAHPLLRIRGLPISRHAYQLPIPLPLTVALKFACGICDLITFSPHDGPRYAAGNGSLHRRPNSRYGDIGAEREAGKAGISSNPKRNETKRNETKRNGPPLVPTGRGGKRDEAARFVETVWKTGRTGEMDIQ